MFKGHWLNYLGTPLVGVMGALIASAIGWPLPWMIGSLVAVILVRCTTAWQLQPFPGGRKFGQWIIGIGIGLHFTPALVGQIAGHLVPIVIGALITVLSSIVGVWFMRRTGETMATAYFSSMPGGSGEMVNLGARNGAELTRVAAAQSLRVVAVVLLVPALFKFMMGEGEVHLHASNPDWPWLALILPLAGAAGWLLHRLKQPNPWLFGPLLVSALFSIGFDLSSTLPAGASQVGQLMIGSALGCFFNRAFFRYAPSFLARTLITTLAMMLVAFVAAVLIGWASGLDFQSLTLGMMPGGIAEMSLTAETLQLAVPLVTAMQVIRLFLVLFFAEPIFRRWLRQENQLSMR
ncbi:AbrB family transcriptional regulator [Pseudomonas sp. MM211]|uniref:AbrB family transcriptional regulator n=1 Tax=Pseudomonas sp. MM211 TaxID=2866808 RepID=UPI001CEC54A2|nr:AbrB family transcriptional regulator [Pseudomonas sp. MM211]UCJ18834.1 AbrB family transcriptional regulator [Pseudomonas sp. MM211]